MKKIWIKIIIFIILQSFSLILYAEIYKWTDNNGRTHYSDRDTTDNPIEVINNKKYNSYSHKRTELEVDNYISRQDTFKLPNASSDVPFRFVLTSRMNVDEPTDNLRSIVINMRQKSFYAHVKLIGAEQYTEYSLRIRILDAKGELIFDQNKIVNTEKSNSASFYARISPNVSIDSSGPWIFQTILNGKKLFVKKRSVLF